MKYLQIQINFAWYHITHSQPYLGIMLKTPTHVYGVIAITSCFV